MKLVLLQALRAFAALLVVMHHAQHEAGLLAARENLAFAPSTLLPWQAGVDVFFVISGFIIVHASAPLYRRPEGRRRFLAHRLARLVPLYWLVSTAYLGLALARPGVLASDPGAGRLEPGYVAASFLFWPALRADAAPLPLYGLGWTLNYEMFFYALFALGIGLGRRGAVAWLAASLAGLVLARAVLPSLPMPLAFWSEPIVLEFALGVGLGLARAEGFRLGGPARLLLVASGLVLLASLPEPGAGLRPLSYGLPALLLVAAATLGPEPREVRASLPVRAACALGDASYALYLVHPFVLRAAREAILHLGLAPPLGPWGTLALSIALCLPIALAIHRLIERPLTRWARGRLDPGPGKAFDGSTARIPPEAERI